MGNLDTNTIIVFLKFLSHSILGMIQGLSILISRKDPKEAGEVNPVYKYIHLILYSGPKSFRNFPSGIKLGRTLFIPLMSLFRKK